MITRMMKYTLFSMNAFSAELMERLQEAGVVDISRSHKSIDSHSEELMARAAEIRQRISGVEPRRRLKENFKAVEVLEKESAASQLWGEYDGNAIEALKEKGYVLNFHMVSAKKFDAGWGAEVPLEVISDDGRQVMFVTVGSPAAGVDIPGRMDMPRPVGTIQADIDALLAERKGIEDDIAGLERDKKALEKEYEGVMADLDAYLARKGSILEGPDSEEDEGGLSSYLDIYEGYAPVECDGQVRSCLDKLPVYYTAEEARDDSTPIKLRNNWFTRQFEVFTGMYGMPVYGEFDPTPILAPFFLLFFSMCMGDAGYGILLVIISIFLKRKMPESGLGRMHSLIMLLGIGTFVVGFFLGTFFGISLYDAAWMPAPLKKLMLVEGNVGKIAGFDPQIVLALAIGVFHICLAMVVKTACVTARTGFINNLSTWGWTLLVVGGIITAALAVGGILGGEALKLTVIAIAAVSCVGIFLFNKPGRNPLANIGSGLWDSYNMATGLLGDTLSYLRLYALGLAGGMLGGAFNNVAGMILGEDPTWQWVPFVLVVVVGHALNLAMSCLGAFVHPLRLSFVEYFKNSGYEGKGVKYQPLKKETNKN